MATSQIHFPISTGTAFPISLYELLLFSKIKSSGNPCSLAYSLTEKGRNQYFEFLSFTNLVLRSFA